MLTLNVLSLIRQEVENLPIPAGSSSPPIPCDLTKPSVEAVAGKVAEALKIIPGQPLEPVVNHLGGRIVYGSRASDELDGGSITARSVNDFVIRLSEMTSTIRDRFTIAHELGHLFLHLPKVREVHPEAEMRATRRVDPIDERLMRAEWEANWFAAELLMPRKLFGPYFERNGIEGAASAFRVSRSAAVVRAKSLGLS